MGARRAGARGSGARQAMGATAAQKKRMLSLCQWQLAWHRCASVRAASASVRAPLCSYSVAAVATEQLTPAEVTAHRNICMLVAVKAKRARARGARQVRSARRLQAGANKRRAHLAIYYDEEARKERRRAWVRARRRAGERAVCQAWAEKSRAGDPSFALGRAALALDVNVLRAAEDAYDRDENAPAAASERRDGGKGRAKGAGSGSARGPNDWGWSGGNAGWGKAWSSAHRGQTKRTWQQWEEPRKPLTPPRAVKRKP